MDPSQPGSTEPQTGKTGSGRKSRGLEDYEVIEKVGGGTFGKVSKIKRKSDGKIQVWKEIYFGNMSEREKQQLVSEVNILREVEHQHIVQYHERIIDKQQRKLYIVMEHCAGGDLASLIKSHKKRRKFVEEAFIWKILAQTASALKACHCKADNKILHRDLKPGNVFLDAEGNVKLGDFGLARILQNSLEYAKTHVGTPYYMSPEQVDNRRYNEQSDIWSLGCLVYELAALTPPFRATQLIALAKKISVGKFNPIPSHFSSDLHKAVESMLQVDPRRRPRIEQILMWPNVLKINSPNTAIESPTSAMSELSRREADLDRREAIVAEQERKLAAWEDRIAQREQELKDRERRLRLKEAQYTSNRKPLTEINDRVPHPAAQAGPRFRRHQSVDYLYH